MNQASISNGFRDIRWRCDAIIDLTLMRPLNKGKGHSFRYQSHATSYRLTVLPHSTVWGHVTSLVTLPFDGPYAISYWWSFGTKPVYL